VPSWSELKGKTVPAGTMIKVDDDFKTNSSSWYNRLKSDNGEDWDGQYLQMRYDEKAGKVLPMAFTPFKKLAEAGRDIGELPDVEVQGLKSPVTDKDAQSWVKEQSGAQAFSKDTREVTPEMQEREASEVWRRYPTAARVKDALTENPALAKLFMGNEKLFNAFKDELDNAAGNQVVNQFDQSDMFAKAVFRVYKLDTEISPDVRQSADAASRLKAIAQDYGIKQGKLAAQMKLAAGDQPEYMELAALESKMAVNPRDVTESDTQRYRELNQLVSNRIAETGKGTKEWGQYIANRAGYASALKSVAQSLNTFNDPDKQSELNTYLLQQKGRELLNRVPNYFPKVKESEQKQAELNASGSATSLGRGLTGAAVKGAENIAMFFARDESGKRAIASNLPGSGRPDLMPEFLTPNRPATSRVNTFLNSLDGGAKMVGSMVPAMLAGAAGGAPAELIAFGAMAGQEARDEAIKQGLNTRQADTYGMLNGLVTAAAMRLQLPGSLIRPSVGLEGLIKNAFSKKSILDYATKILVPTGKDITEMGIATAQAAAMDIANSVVNSQYNKSKGTKFETLEPTKLTQSMAGMGVMAYLFQRIGKVGEIANARPLLYKAFQDAPQETLDALDMARKKLLLDAGNGDQKAGYALSQITKAHDLLSEYSRNKSGLLPSVTEDQHAAQAMIVSDIENLKAQRAEALPELHAVLNDKIEAAQKKLHEVVNNPDTASNHVQVALEPLHAVAGTNPEPQRVFTDLDHTLVTSDTDDSLTPWGEEVKAQIASGELNPGDVHIVSRNPDAERAKRIAKEIGIPEENVATGIATPEGKSAYIESRGGKDSDIFVDDRSENRQAVEDKGVKSVDVPKNESEPKPDTNPRIAKLDDKIAELRKTDTPESHQEADHLSRQKELIKKYGMDSNEIRKKLEDEGKLTIKCPPGAKKRLSFKNLFKAKDGIKTNNSSGKWEIVKDIKGDSHYNGGVDVTIKGQKIEAEGQELKIKNNLGSEAIIPKKMRERVLDLLDTGNHDKISNIVKSLPVMPEKAGEGGMYKSNTNTETPVPEIYTSDVKEYFRKLMFSPRILNILKKSGTGATDQQTKEYAVKRFKNIQSTPAFSTDLGESIGGEFTGGKVLINTSQLSNKNIPTPEKAVSVLAHEYSHAQEGSDEEKTLIPEKDKELIISLANPSAKGDMNEYIKRPTETRARLNQIRYLGDFNKIYDATKEDFDQKHLDKLKDELPMQQLRQVYSDEAIIQLMNSVSLSEKGKYNTTA